MTDLSHLPTCKGCGRPVRPQRSENIPGTVRYGAKDECSKCYQRRNRAEQKADRERREAARRRQAHHNPPPAPTPEPEPELRIADLIPNTATTWQTDALCAQVDSSIFFPEKGESTRDAKTVCGSCPVKAQCLQFSLDNNIEHGVWGGVSPRDRAALKRRARRAA